MSPNRWKELLENCKKDKLLIGIGCSFTQGQGGLSDEVWEKYNWNIPNTHEISEIEPLELEGSWVNQLCKNHMSDWTPINLGERGAGNRAASKYLTSVFPEFDLENNDKEKIVVFMLSGPERYTVVDNRWKERYHGVFQSIWPNPDSDNELWRAYANVMYSEKQSMMETYFAIKEVQDWCKYNNAKLIITSGFSFDYYADYTKENIKKTIELDWQLDLFLPEDHPSFFHLLLDMDGFDYNIQNGGYWDALNYNDEYPTGTPHVSRCCHPNLKGHTKIAEVLYDKIKEL